jgi:hypothetical protein
MCFFLELMHMHIHFKLENDRMHTRGLPAYPTLGIWVCLPYIYIVPPP